MTPILSLSQDLDTLVDVGDHKLHFTIWEGEGIPILFEAGGGNDATIWSHLIEPLRSITGTTLITYDRPGMGKSEVNPHLPEDKKGLITNAINDLEKGLSALGYREEILLVSHSYGGFSSALYSARNPDLVKGIVLIDTNLPTTFTDAYLKKFEGLYTPSFLDTIKSISLGAYYESIAIYETTKIMRGIEFPAHIPIIDIVAENPPNQFNDSVDVIHRQVTHRQFVKEAANRRLITAYECEHFLFFQNPALVIQSIVQLYGQVSTDIDYKALLNRSLAYGVENTNNTRRSEFAYWHSERDLNNWGYTLMNRGELASALSIFKLNTQLFPESFNTYDSYGEALLKVGKKEEAINMYQKSIELNPDNEAGKKILEGLLIEH